ncbi:MAG TPA: GrpB family protein [Candidatus Limnocylindrales bacterium]|nr:GrpB family protein [Candidatus Limnocylindrales bacterium]
MTERHVPQRELAATDAQLQSVTIGERRPHDGPVILADADPGWALTFEREAARIRAALGDRVMRLEHTGSTSVPGLAAKPIVDMTLAVVDSADEPAYVPALERAGYVLRIREPAWLEHRLFKGPEADVNLHVFSAGSVEIERMVGFRDWLRSHADDRELYERTKRELAARTWRHVQHYADAKTAVVEEIIARAGLPPRVD